MPLDEYVKSVVKEAILKRQRIQQLSENPFDEILKPFRDEVESSGISDDELDNLFQQARREASQARRGETHVSFGRVNEEGGDCLPRKINQKSWTHGRRVREKGRPGSEERGTGGGAGRRDRGGRAAGEPSLTVAA